MHRGQSNPSLRNSSREDEQDRATLFSMSGETRHPLPPLPGSDSENNGPSHGSNSNNTGGNAAGLGAGTPLPPSFSRVPPQMSQTQEGQRVSIAGLPPSTSASSTPPLPPPPLPAALARSRTVGSRPFSDLTRVPPRGNRSDSSSFDKSPLDEHPMSPSGRELDLGLHQVSPLQIVLPMEGGDDGGEHGRDRKSRPGASRTNTNRTAPGIDWIVPQAVPALPRVPSPRGPRTVEERMSPTIEHARLEEKKSNKKAQVTSYALNIAIGLQVLISAMITGLSAVTSGKNTQIMTSILGGAGTVVASYLARARGSNEPELSISRVKDLQRYIRECEAFVQDHGLETGHEFDERIDRLREDFEHLLGNGNGERKLSNTSSA